jgi:hypothetical protein
VFAGSAPVKASACARTTASTSHPGRQQKAGPQDVVSRRAELFRSGERPRDDLARLLVCVGRDRRCGSAHGDVVPLADATGIGSGLFEAAALPIA